MPDWSWLARPPHRFVHSVREVRGPSYVELRCTCGWYRQVTRRQNALARNSRLIKYWNEHQRTIRKQNTNALGVPFDHRIN